ncbi:hypothetical protein PM082_021208 [Marasmius tenuissimus]|nr:hypothetical protein PM082_021208 [Marasmius tenuissimus]
MNLGVSEASLAVADFGEALAFPADPPASITSKCSTLAQPKTEEKKDGSGGQETAAGTSSTGSGSSTSTPSDSQVSSRPGQTTDSIPPSTSATALPSSTASPTMHGTSPQTGVTIIPTSLSADTGISSTSSESPQISPPNNPPSSQSSTRQGTIVGSVLGTIAFLLLLCAFLLIRARRKRSRPTSRPHTFYKDRMIKDVEQVPTPRAPNSILTSSSSDAVSRTSLSDPLEVDFGGSPAVGLGLPSRTSRQMQIEQKIFKLQSSLISLNKRTLSLRQSSGSTKRVRAQLIENRIGRLEKLKEGDWAREKSDEKPADMR